jgi:hypothetical protein
VLTCAHNVALKMKAGDKTLKIANEISLILGKYPGSEIVVNDRSILKLILDPNDVIYPTNYKYNNPDGGYDVALIGLSKENKQKLNIYLEKKYK